MVWWRSAGRPLETIGTSSPIFKREEAPSLRFQSNCFAWRPRTNRISSDTVLIRSFWNVWVLRSSGVLFGPDGGGRTEPTTLLLVLFPSATPYKISCFGSAESIGPSPRLMFTFLFWGLERNKNQACYLRPTVLFEASFRLSSSLFLAKESLEQ